MQSCEILPKKWVSFGLWGVCNFDSTYDVRENCPPITQPRLVDLSSFRSVTACRLAGGDAVTQDGKTYEPFYRDQQDCVIWYKGADGKIYWPDWDDSKMTLCADSMEEFTTRVAIENSLWHKLRAVREAEKGDYFSTNIEKDIILKHWDKFTPEEQEYISFYFNK